MKRKLFKINQTDGKIRTVKEMNKIIDTLNDYRGIIVERGTCSIVAFDNEKDLGDDYNNYISVDHCDLDVYYGSLYLYYVKYDFEDELKELSEGKKAKLEKLLEKKLGCWISCKKAQIEIDIPEIQKIVSGFLEKNCLQKV